MQRLAQIAERLFSHGLALDTPAIIVRDGTRPTQTVIACSLRRWVEMAPAYGLQPGMLIIGETVRISPYHHADRRTGSCLHASRTGRGVPRHCRAARHAALFREHGRPRSDAPPVDRRSPHAPSVGFMQLWRFVRVVSSGLRTQLQAPGGRQAKSNRQTEIL